MQILITGGTGLIGRALIKKLPHHRITVLTRDTQKARTLLPKEVTLISDLDEVDFNGLDGVINLAGEPILDNRWSEKQKKRLCDSRWEMTQNVVERINKATSPPYVFISGSAVGYYAHQKEKKIDETFSITSDDFPHHLCARWEDIAKGVNDEHTRLCLVRTGIVLSPNGGALQKMRLPYQLGLGATLGAGDQYVPWIHIEDMVNALVHLLEHKEAKGIFNFTAPHPVTQKVWSQALAKSLRRPHFLFVPSFMLNLILGQGAQLLLEGQRAYPVALQKNGYVFRFTKIDEAFNDLIKS